MRRGEPVQKTRKARERVYALAVALALLGSAILALLGSRPEAEPPLHAVSGLSELAGIAAPPERDPFSARENAFHARIAPGSRERALHDVDARINPSFHVPRGMENLVGFWFAIYTEYSSEQRVFYDLNHPEVVYEVLDFRPISETAPNRVAYEVVANRRLDDAVRAYKRAFKHLSSTPAPQNPTREETRILSALRRHGHKHSFRAWGAGLRVQTGQRDNVVRGVAAGAAHFPRMERLFEIMGVPSELTRLSLVESSFNANAVSRVGAAGVWQFMRDPGYKWLRIEDTIGSRGLIDERLSPLKSAVAAARLLESNHKILGNWPLATTSYNHGFTHLPHWPKNADLNKIGRLFALCPRGNRMGYASANFYAEFLAVLHADRYRELFYGQPVVPRETGLAFRHVENETTASGLADELDVPVFKLRELNPDLVGSDPRLPVGYLAAVPASQDNLVALIESTSVPKTLSARRSSRRGVRLASYYRVGRSPHALRPIKPRAQRIASIGSLRGAPARPAIPVAKPQARPADVPVQPVSFRVGRAEL